MSMAPDRVMEMDLYFAVMLMRDAEKLNRRAVDGNDGTRSVPATRDLGGGRTAVRITDMGQLKSFLQARGGGV